MPRATYGPQVKSRSKRLFHAIAAFAQDELEGVEQIAVRCSWQSDADAPTLIVRTTLRALEELCQKDGLGTPLTKAQIREALSRMADFLQILEDVRETPKGTENWHFKLTLWSRDTTKNVSQFDQLWETNRSPKSKEQQTAQTLLSAEDFMRQGLEKADQSDYQGAISHYNQVIVLDPNLANAYRSRGFAYFALGNYGAALDDYNQAIRLNPNYADAYNNRGNILLTVGGQQGAINAIENYTRAIEIEPNIDSYYFNRGNAYLKLGNKQRAIIDYEQTIRLNPTSINAYINRGGIRNELGDMQGALADYEHAIELQPGSVKAYINLGSLYSALGHKEKAITVFQNAIELCQKQENKDYFQQLALKQIEELQ